MRRVIGLLSFWICFLVCPAGIRAQTGAETACAGCHRAIYESYLRTGMAQSSGRVGIGPFQESTAKASFTQGAAEYEVARESSGFVLRVTDGGATAKRTLDYFIGSGRTGRSYASLIDAYLFESPVSYYSADSSWRISPGYQRNRNVQLLRPVETACLNCHASELDPLPGSVNGYRMPPFRQAGVGCERCHGPGEKHVASMRSGAAHGGAGIVNPAKLDPARRESVCRQCHLAGEVRSRRPRRHSGPAKFFRSGWPYLCARMSVRRCR